MQGIFFDLGGTLYSYRNLKRTMAPLVVDAGRRLGAEEQEMRAIGRAYKAAGDAMAHRYATLEYYLHRDYFRDTFYEFARLLGTKPSEDVWEWFARRQHEALLECLVLKADCHTTLANLRERGLYLSVVSNIDEDMFGPLMNNENLADYFHHYTSSETSGSCKPHRRFFEHCLEISGLRAQDVLFVGDSPEHDIAGAAAVGMKTALIVDEGIEPPLQTGRDARAADHVVQSLSELADLVSA